MIDVFALKMPMYHRGATCYPQSVSGGERLFPPSSEAPGEHTPRERLSQFGAETLSTVELIAMVIGTGNSNDKILEVASDLLNTFHGLVGLFQAHPQEFQVLSGIGKTRALRLSASLELGRRLSAAKAPDDFLIASPKDAARILMPIMSYLPQEEMHVMLLNGRGRVIGIPQIYRGSLNTAVVRAAEIYRPAVVHRAATIILAHNHPSGDPAPSSEDVASTRFLIEAGKQLEIPMQDHLVIGMNCYVSMKERGLAFSD